MRPQKQLEIYQMAYKRAGATPRVNPLVNADAVAEAQRAHRLQEDLRYRMSQMGPVMAQDDRLEREYWSKHDPNILRRVDPGSGAFREAVYARDAKKAELEAAHFASLERARGPRWWRRSDLRADIQSPRARRARYNRYWEKTLARAKANRDKYRLMQQRHRQLTSAPSGAAVAGR